jgi:hypothetical protein
VSGARGFGGALAGRRLLDFLRRGGFACGGLLEVRLQLVARVVQVCAGSLELGAGEGVGLLDAGVLVAVVRDRVEEAGAGEQGRDEEDAGKGDGGGGRGAASTPAAFPGLARAGGAGDGGGAAWFWGLEGGV